MPTIALDATYSIDPEPTGIAVYSRRLIESLVQLPSNHRYFACYRLSRWRQRRAFMRPSSDGRLGVRFYQAGLTFWLPWQAQLFHSLAQRPPAFHFRHEVVTVFDIFPITGTDYSTPEFQSKFSALLAEAVGRAARIITASQYTAGQLQRHCQVESDRIRVIPVGVDLPPKQVDPAERRAERSALVGAGNELVLVVGAIQNRKNSLGAVRAASRFPPRYRMVLAGGNGHGSESVHSFIRDQRLGDRVLTPGYVSPDKLESLYRAASVLLFPSFEEGFGIPVLEAMAHGVPVVAARASSLPEVGADAVLYADPHSVDEITARVAQIIENPDLASDLARRGRARAAQFTWQQTAERTLQVYDELLAGMDKP